LRIVNLLLGGRGPRCRKRIVNLLLGERGPRCPARCRLRPPLIPTHPFRCRTRVCEGGLQDRARASADFVAVTQKGDMHNKRTRASYVLVIRSWREHKAWKDRWLERHNCSNNTGQGSSNCHSGPLGSHLGLDLAGESRCESQTIIRLPCPIIVCYSHRDSMHHCSMHIRDDGRICSLSRD
jgi:hypothetical protein